MKVSRLLKAIALLLPLMLINMTATAASVAPRVVEIRQVNPSGDAQVTLCQEAGASCHIDMDIFPKDANQSESLTVKIVSTPDKIHLTFTSKGGVARTDKGGLLEISSSGRAHRVVTLFRPPDYSEDGRSLVLKGPGEAFVQLEITVLPVQ